MYTEQEAGTKWCPLATRSTMITAASPFSIQLEPPSTRKSNGDPAGLCLGSHCMMWRWGPPITGSAAVYAALNKESVPRLGYCGLAGKFF